MRLLVDEKWVYTLIAMISGFLLALALVETYAYHDDVTKVTVTDAREPSLTRYRIDLFIDVYRVRLSYGWRRPSVHGTSDNIGKRLSSKDEIAARIGGFTGVMLSATKRDETRYLVREPSFMLAVLSFLVYLVPALRRPEVLLIAACLQAYAGIWLALACFQSVPI